MSWRKEAKHHEREASEYRDAATYLDRAHETAEDFLSAADEHDLNAAECRMRDAMGLPYTRPKNGKS